MASVELTGHLVADEQGNLYIGDLSLNEVVSAVFAPSVEERTTHFGFVRIEIEKVG